MYFRDGVSLHTTVHREVLYTNLWLSSTEGIELPVGVLAPSTSVRPVSTVTVSVTEHVEAEFADGRPSMLVATDGTTLIDALADVLSFGLNAVFSRDHDLVERLVPDSVDGSRRTRASSLFRRTFDGHRYVTAGEFDELRSLMTHLLTLKRANYEAAMRAIRRVVGATQRAVNDPTVAYVDLVAALESLSDGVDVPTPTWDRMPGDKRKLIDDALDGADSDLAGRVRAAVIEAEKLGAGSRFVAFVLGNITPSYFRTEATNASRPMRGPDLEQALRIAYGIRSRNVHALEDLPPEAWVIGDRADTVSPPGVGTMLSHEGLARLARHVIRNYTLRAPTGVDPEFDWWSSLPGQVRMQAAPQYWIWNAQGFDAKAAGRYFSGFLQHLLEVRADRVDALSDITPVLERIEQLLPGLADGEPKALMLAIYAIWNETVPPENRRPVASELLNKHHALLNKMDIPSFVVKLFANDLPEWTADQWLNLASDRRAQRSKRRYLQLPPSIDAALQVIAADQLMDSGRADEALTAANAAVEELPGDKQLLNWEATFGAAESAALDLWALILGTEPTATPSPETSEAADPTEPQEERADD